MSVSESDLIYDWNVVGGDQMALPRGKVEIDEETLRDGLQSPSVKSPPIEDKLRILHYIAELGIESANIGLPGAGAHVQKDVERIAREIVDQRLPILANCAARTVIRDIEPIVEIAQRTGLVVEASCFIGSSPVRQYTENWELDRMLSLVHDAVAYAVGEGLPVMFVTEDTTRANPEHLRRLYTTAVEAGARRVCIADTVGHATPVGVSNLVRFIREVVDGTGEDVKVDWHGHKDRGLAIINSLVAAASGADRLHGTALGIGERVGNTPVDLLLVNMHLLGWVERDLSKLTEYCEFVAAKTGVPLPDNYPVIGRDAFRTMTGVHAAAIIKARAKGDEWLADLVYSGVPAALVGKRQVIEVGPMSGESNVVCWLEEHGVESDPELVKTIFRRAKESSKVLDEPEIRAMCEQLGFEVPVRPAP